MMVRWCYWMASTKYDLVDLGDSRISSETECRQHLQRDRTIFVVQPQRASSFVSADWVFSKWTLRAGSIKQFCKQPSNSHQVCPSWIDCAVGLCSSGRRGQKTDFSSKVWWGGSIPSPLDAWRSCDENLGVWTFGPGMIHHCALSIPDHPNKWHYIIYISIYIYIYPYLYIYICVVYTCIYIYILYFKTLCDKIHWHEPLTYGCGPYGYGVYPPVTKVSCCWPLFFWFATLVASFWRTALNASATTKPPSLRPGNWCLIFFCTQRWLSSYSELFTTL